MESDGDKSAHQMGTCVTAVKCSHAFAAFAVEGDEVLLTIEMGRSLATNGLQCHCSQVFTCICCICCQGQGWSLKTNGSAVHHRKVHEHVHVLQFRNSTFYCNGPAMARTLHQESAADAVKCCCNWRDAAIVVTLGGLAF